MAWVIPLQTEWQFGEMSVEEARPRKVQSTLYQFLVAGSGGEDAVTKALAEKGAVFAKIFVLYRVNPRGDKLAKDLFDKVVAEASTGPSRLYLMALHGLLWRLAAGPIAHALDRDPVDDDTDDGEQDGEDKDDEPALDADDAESEGARHVFWCARHEIRGDLARSLAREYAQYLGCDEDALWSAAALVAEVLLEALLLALPDTLKLVIDRIQGRSEDGKPRTIERIRVESLDLAMEIRLWQTLRALPYRLTFQPLNRPPVYQRKKDIHTTSDGPPQSLLGYRRRNQFLRDFHAIVEVGEAYVKAVNVQQAVAWRINHELLRIAKHITGLLAYERTKWVETLADEVNKYSVSETTISGWKDWTARKFYRPLRGDGPRRSYVKPGELLDHPLAKAALEDLAQVTDGQQPTFYLPWKADYRGRIYPHTPWLTPQGGDLQRALFEFAEGTPVNEKGFLALKRHGANLVKRDVILRCLQQQPVSTSESRKVISFDERVQWIDGHNKQLLDFATAPLVHTEWRELSDKPMQFLAFCLAYRQHKENPNAPCHLPVQIDGSCNGLQHIAAITGDRKLARAVNVVARDDKLPGDIYSDVAKTAKTATGRGGSEIACQALKALKPLEWIKWIEWINRDMAKKVIMTVPYGASEHGQTENVLEKIAARLDRISDQNQSELWSIALNLGKSVQALEEQSPTNKESKWLCHLRGHLRGVVSNFDSDSSLRRLAKEAYTAIHDRNKQAQGAPTTNEATPEAWLQWLGIAALSACLAAEIVHRLRWSLNTHFPAAFNFAKWLKDIGDRCAGLPLAWLSPLGLPVCQDDFKLQRTTLNATFGGQSISIGISRLTQNVHSQNQNQALLPNLIHSLDATHLAMTINAAVDSGITRFGSIHDCLLCHPNEAEQLGVIVRATFAELYEPVSADDRRPKVLADWHAWMQIVAGIAVSPPNFVQGALDRPGGSGEKKLDEVGKAVVEGIRSLDETRKTMAKQLIKFREESTNAKRNAKRKTFPEITWQYAFDVNLVKASPYFFS